MNLPPKLRKFADNSSGLAPLSRSLCPSRSLRPSLVQKSPPRSCLLVRNRSTGPQREVPLPRGQSRSLLGEKSRRRRLQPKPLRELRQKLLGRNPGFKEAQQKKDLRDLDPHREMPPGNRRSESLKQRGPLHARLLGRMRLGCMKDNPVVKKKVLLTSLYPKSFQWASNSACSMGTLFVLVTLKLGGWWMALGGRFLQARFSPMPLL